MNVRIRENIFTVSEFSETVYFFFMVSKIFGNPLICKKNLYAHVREILPAAHSRWFEVDKKADSEEADQLDLTTSDTYIFKTYLLPCLKNIYLYSNVAMLYHVCFS